VSLAGVVLTVMASGLLVTSDTVANLAGAPSAVLYATLGAVVVRRAGNVIGWFLLGIGAGLAINTSASAYAVLGITHPGTLPAPELVGLLAEWSFVPLFSAIVFMLLLFPSGTLPSPRWRPFAALALLATALAMAGFVVHPRQVSPARPGRSAGSPRGGSRPGNPGCAPRAHTAPPPCTSCAPTQPDHQASNAPPAAEELRSGLP
jgi:hypothetical protein